MACSWPIEITDDGLASSLYISIVTEKWRKVVNLYKEHGISAITSKINTTGDTAFHLAVSMAPQRIVEKLLEIMKSSESGLRVTNNEGNTPLHVAASSGKLETSILLAKFDGFLGGVRNNRGESPLFSATYHGKKEIFLYLHHTLHPETSRDIKDTSLYRRNDGDTILHSAISREYFDLAFEILRAVPSLAYAENERGITPLHILASKPSVFRSSCLIQLWDWRTIIYYCTWLFVGRLKQEPASQRFVNSVIEGFPESNNFQKYIKFFQGMAHAVALASPSIDIETVHRTDEEHTNKAKSHFISVVSSVGNDRLSTNKPLNSLLTKFLRTDGLNHTMPPDQVVMAQQIQALTANVQELHKQNEDLKQRACPEGTSTSQSQRNHNDSDDEAHSPGNSRRETSKHTT
ncbi:uncharacterized protein LOC142624297 [Castanea sativa]|uniref:uncharacterized protein LOC142624297 n=1 Tax=Castanea sativa TaxID=21020 RepID=UPI003F6496F6